MKEWGQARGRMEAEIARKKEHLNAATNFAAARGWTRTCWKSKNHKPAAETQEEFLAASSSEEDEPVKAELASEIAESPTRFGRSEGLGTKSATLRTSGGHGHGAPAPKVHDLAKDDADYGYRLSTEDMVKQLGAIDEHNRALPPRKRAKESLPEISAPNVHCKTVISRDHKKGTVNYLRKYHNIGFVDASPSHDPEAARGGASAFSVAS